MTSAVQSSLALSPRVAVSGIDGSGKTTLCDGLRRWLMSEGWAVHIIGNLPRAYRRTNNSVVDPDDPFLSSFFFNYAFECCGDPGSARFLFDPRYIDYVMAVEEVRLYYRTVRDVRRANNIFLHDRHILDRRVNAYQAGCPRSDIDLILGYVPPPNLTILLDVSPEIAMYRVRQRGKPGKDENITDLAYYRRMYLECVASEPNRLILDASNAQSKVLETVLPYVRTVLDPETRSGEDG